jgi:hypothetical protein
MRPGEVMVGVNQAEELVSSLSIIDSNSITVRRISGIQMDL